MRHPFLSGRRQPCKLAATKWGGEACIVTLSVAPPWRSSWPWWWEGRRGPLGQGQQGQAHGRFVAQPFDHHAGHHRRRHHHGHRYGGGRVSHRCGDLLACVVPPRWPRPAPRPMPGRPSSASDRRQPSVHRQRDRRSQLDRLVLPARQVQRRRHYKKVTDNDTATECLDVTSGGGGGRLHAHHQVGSQPSTTTVNGSAVDTATVTGNATAGSPTGSVDLLRVRPDLGGHPCTSRRHSSPWPRWSSPPSRVTARSPDVTIQPSTGTGWYCFLDQYSGDANYKPVSDNDAATECSTSPAGRWRPDSTPTIKSR